VAVPYLGILVIIVMILASAIRVLREYERAVVFRLGRLIGEKGPGLIFLIPLVDRMVRVSLRVVAMDVVYFRVMDANKAINEVEDFLYATTQLAQTTLRSVLGQVELDQLLSEREEINHKLQQIIDEQTDAWGVKVSLVEVKHVDLPSEMQRAIARQAEAERERRSKVIHADGEFQASTKLREAADVMAANPTTLQLRFLQTLTEVATEKNSTIVFPIPIDLFRPYMEKTSRDSS
jgi:regulator of protease activity HflC (stomatin/prohibitin superfamily)